ncbi:acyltransferase [Oxalobacteraceae bacterium OTU3CINTB1]|nr:acyltransferase [Oxalobacteraceae bacterium OTU3CINTB1]
MGTAVKGGFRSDINGLRAWAVLAVILFHFKIPGLDGGYVGVDIFFVLSGFLMTGIIARALQGGAADRPGQFLWKFFLARGLRIWPALLVMCAALFVVGWFTMSPDEFRSYGEQARSAVLFFSNIKFWRETGYFTANAHSLWLLHTWSLSVEWQFYVVLPIAMLVAWRIRPTPRALVVLLIAGAVVSLALCLVMAQRSPGTAFFLLPCRAWEMIAGGLVALGAPRAPRSAAVRHALELGGLALIGYAILAFGHLVWPDWHALVPVLGTVMVLIAAKEDSVLTNWAPLRWIGARSYSMYLWHWPLVVAIYYFGDDADLVQTACALLLTFLLGHLSYELVETRMRRPLDRLPRGAGSAALAAACLLVVVPGTVIAMQGGIPGRLSPEIQNMFATSAEKQDRMPDCRIVEHGDARGCATAGSELGVIVLGDSHAIALFDAVRQALPRPDLRAERWATHGCPSMRHVYTVGNPSPECDRLVGWALDRLASVPATVPVVIINRGSLYMEGQNELHTDDDIAKPGIYMSKQYATRTPEFYKEVRDNMVDTACTIAKRRKVYMVRPIPERRIDVPNVMGHAMTMGKPREIAVPLDEYAKRHARVWQAQDEAHARCGVVILDPLPYLCRAGRCESVEGQRALYFDDDHLSRYGASRLTPMFSTVFAGGHATAHAHAQPGGAAP